MGLRRVEETELLVLERPYQTNIGAPPLPYRLALRRKKRRLMRGVRRLDATTAMVTASETAPGELLLDAADGVALHVGTLRRGKEALLLVGAPGAGKSTLSVALGKRGYELEGDDLAALLPDGRVRAIALPVTLKEGSWQVLSHLHPELQGGEAFVHKAIQRGLLIIPGNIFSARDSHFRISFAAPDETIRKGISMLNQLGHEA